MDDILVKLKEKIDNDSKSFSEKIDQQCDAIKQARDLIEKQADEIKALKIKKHAEKVYNDAHSYAEEFGKTTEEKEDLYKYKKWVKEDPVEEKYADLYWKAFFNPAKKNDALNFLDDVKNDNDISPLKSLTKQALIEQDSMVSKSTIGTVIGQSAGYLLAPYSLDNMVHQLMYETSPIRRYATVKKLKVSQAKVVVESRRADAVWGSLERPQPRTQAPNYTELTTGIDALSATVGVTMDLVQDSYFDAIEEVKKSVARAFMLSENQQFVQGRGIQTPYGIGHYFPQATSESSRSKEEFLKPILIEDSVSNFNSLDMKPISKMIDMQSSIFEEYRKKAVFAMSRKTLGNLKKAVTSDGLFLLDQGSMWGSPQGLKAMGMGTMIAGSPVILLEDMDDVGSNKYPVFYGDLSSYCIYDRVGMYSLVENITVKGTWTCWFSKRMGAMAVNCEGWSVLKTT